MMENFEQAEGEKIILPELVSNENIFYGSGALVCKRENKYWLDYMSAGHGGFSIIYEISEDEYQAIRDDKISFTELIAKYPERAGDVERSRSIEMRWKALGLN